MSTVTEPETMLDWSQIAQLRGEIGAEDFDEVVGLFLEEVAETVERLRAPDPPKDLAGLLHFLKGSALNFGFSTLAELCAAGERLAAEGRASDVDLSAVVTAFERSRAELLDGLPRLDEGTQITNCDSSSSFVMSE